jgi:tight adherence protein B
MHEKEALDNISQRVNSEYLQWVVTAINVQREVGGNLAEVMDTIADTIRERDRVLNRVKALTSEGRLSAIILIILPIVVGLMLFFLNRDYISLLFVTRAGLIMLAIAGALMVVGIIWIMRIVNIKY